MKADRYDDIMHDLMIDALNIEKDKRVEYTIDDPDVLANFKRVAARAGVSSYDVWLVYFLKHVDAITTICKHARNKTPHKLAEPMRGRFIDAISYLRLGYALLFEESEALKQPPHDPLIRE